MLNQIQKIFLKTFLLDSSLADNGMKINKAFLRKHIDKFIGKDVILTPDRHHPLEFNTYTLTNNAELDINNLIALQQKHRIGKIVKVNSNDNEMYSAIVEIDTARGSDLYKRNLLPRYVSPSIYSMSNIDSDVRDYYPLHLALVSSPAYGDKASIIGTCHDTEHNCTAKLAQASSNRAIKEVSLNELLQFTSSNPREFNHESIYHNTVRAEQSSGNKQNNQLNELIKFTEGEYL